VGPIGENPDALKSCYLTTMKLVEEHKLRSIALCCVSTGIFGYPLERASHIALKTIRDWLCESNNSDLVDRIIFCVFLDKERVVYEKLMPIYFPTIVPKPLAPPVPIPIIKDMAQTFVWPWGGYHVQIAGTFTRWERVNMSYVEGTHQKEFILEPNHGYQYKFIIDGEWRYDGLQPTAPDDLENVNNYIFLQP